ncbi:MAG: hypothetical protein KatS3mg087_1589 [Patescibacteria group bacterium]|nr:MAG: hypothetical protein KatS3mg087_1589 [Patescibacteria group bacterium]
MKRREQGVTPATQRAIEGVAKDEPLEEALTAVAEIVYSCKVRRLQEKGYDPRDAAAGANAKDLLTIPPEQIRAVLGKDATEHPISRQTQQREKFNPTRPKRQLRDQRGVVNLERITGQPARTKK